MTSHVGREPRPSRLDWDRINRALVAANEPIQRLINNRPVIAGFQLASAIQSVSFADHSADLALQNPPLTRHIAELRHQLYQVEQRYDFVLLRATRPLSGLIDDEEYALLDQFAFAASTIASLKNLGRFARMEPVENSTIPNVTVGYPLVISDLYHFITR